MVKGDWDALFAFSDKYFLGKEPGRTFDHFPDDRTSAKPNPPPAP